MTNQDKSEFVRQLTGLAELFDKKISDALFEIYWQSLQELSLEDFKRAATSLALSAKFFPKPVEFREQILPNLDAQASLAYDKLHEAYLRLAPYHTVTFDDPVIHAVVNSLGGWIKLANLTVDEAKWYRKDFEAKYKNYAPQIRNLNVPTRLVGQFELNNSERFPEYVTPPQIIGNEAKALAWSEERKALQANTPREVKALTAKAI